MTPYSWFEGRDMLKTFIYCSSYSFPIYLMPSFTAYNDQGNKYDYSDGTKYSCQDGKYQH